MAQPSARRSYGIDLLKSIAILCVIVIHTCAYSYPLFSFDWFSSVFWGSFVRAGVPLFFLCSGALFLSPEKPFSTKKLFTRSIPRILAAMLFWGAAYKVYHLVDAGFSLPGLLQGVKEVLVFNQEFHLYYLQIILLVYLFLPITGLITRHATRRELEYLLLLWFVLGIVYPTVASFWPFNLLGMMIPQFKMNMTYAAIGYGVLGHYLRQYPPRRSTGLLLALGGFALTFGGTVGMSARDGGLNTLFLEGMSVGVALMTAGIFSLCIHAPAPRSPRVERAVTYVSKASFCIFLTHVFFNYIFPKHGFSIALFPPIVSIPLVACVTFGVSLCVYAVLSHIPVVKKWLV